MVHRLLPCPLQHWPGAAKQRMLTCSKCLEWQAQLSLYCFGFDFRSVGAEHMWKARPSQTGTAWRVAFNWHVKYKHRTNGKGRAKREVFGSAYIHLTATVVLVTCRVKLAVMPVIFVIPIIVARGSSQL